MEQHLKSHLKHICQTHIIKHRTVDWLQWDTYRPSWFLELVFLDKLHKSLWNEPFVGILFSMVAWRKKVLGSNLGQRFICMTFAYLHVSPMHPWVLYGYTRFLLYSKNMDTWLIGLAEFPLGESVCTLLCILCVSLLLCDEKGTCPGCNLRLTKS